MSTACNFSQLESGEESLLNKKLNKIYSTNISAAPGYSGSNDYYIKIRTDEKFLEWFGGDWNNPEIAAKLKAQAGKSAIFNEQGEPMLKEDTDGNVYIQNAAGDWDYIKPLTSIVSPKEVETIVNSFTGEFISEKAGAKLGSFISERFKKDYNDLREHLDAEYLKIQELDSFEEQEFAMDMLRPYEVKFDKIEELHENKALQDRIKRKVMTRLNSQGFKARETASDKADNIDVYDDIVNFQMEANETSNRAIHDPVILRFLSSVPVYTEYADDPAQQVNMHSEMNTLMSSPMYMNQSDIWGQLEEIFADIIPDMVRGEGRSKDVFDNYLTALEVEARERKHGSLNYVYNYLKNLDQQEDVSDPHEFATKLVSAFFKSKQNYLITQVDTKEVKGVYKTTFKIIDPAVTGNKVGKISNDYIESIVASKVFNSKSEYKNVRDGYKKDDGTYEPGLLKRYAEIAKKSNPQLFADFLDHMLNDVFHLNVSSDIINYHIRRNTTERDGLSKLKQGLNNFFTNEVVNEYVRAHTDKNASVTGEMALLGEMSFRDKSEEAREVFKKRLTANGSFIKDLAISAKAFTTDLSETAFIVGGSKRWAYSYTSGLMFEINKIKNGDTSALDIFKNRGFKFIEHLLTDPEAQSHRELLKVVTNSEIKEARDSNPSLHKRLTELDYHMDNYFKMFNSTDEFHDDTTKRKQATGAAEEQRLLEFANYLIYNFGADKNSLFALFGLPNPGLDMHDFFDIKTKTIGEDFKDRLNKYIIGELELAQIAGEQINEYKSIEDPNEKRQYLMNNLIPGYHYVLEKYTTADEKKNPAHKKGAPKRDIEVDELTDSDFLLGTYYKLGIFSNSVTEFMKDDSLKGMMLLQDTGHPMIDPNFKFTDKIIGPNPNLAILMEQVYKDVNKNVNRDHDYLKGIIRIKKELDNGDKLEVGLFDVLTNANIGDPSLMAYKYVVSSFMINYELSNMFNGHISYYKQSDNNNINLIDFLKRAPAVNTTGRYPRHREQRRKNPEKLSAEDAKLKYGKTYRDYNGTVHDIYDRDDNIVVAVSNDIKLSKSEHSQVISQASGENTSFGYELADAQGYSTPQHHKDMITRIYGWSETTDEKNFNELMDPNHNVTDENVRWLKTSYKSNTPIKLVYFGLDENGMPVYLKYSVAPLFPAMIKGTQMQIILDRMEYQGVEQLVFKSGSKASNKAPTTIHLENEDGTYAGVNPDMKLNPFLIDGMKIKLQTEMPTKLDKETDLSSQSIKNILTNMDMGSSAKVYILKDKDGKETRHTAKEMYDKVTSTGQDILDFGLTKVLNKLGYNFENKDEHEFQLKRIKRLLIRQMDIETESDLIDLLKTDLPLETIPGFAGRAFPVIAGYIDKNAGKIKTNGGSVVQVANVGYDRLSEKDAQGVFFFGKQTKLTPPLPVTDKEGRVLYYPEDGGKPILEQKEGYHPRIKKAKIILPFSSIFAKTGLSYNEFIELYKAGKIDQRLFTNILGYRMPNQSMSSNDSFEIVGILPPLAGDQAVVYHEITAKTGSDFDIDKMYLAMPNFYVKNNYILPEESQKLIDKLKKHKLSLPHLGEFMEYQFESGNQILGAFLVDDQVRKFVTDSGITITNNKTSIEQPVKFLLDNYDVIEEMITKNESYLETDEYEVDLIDILEDVRQAHAKQKDHNRNLLEQYTADKKAELKKIYKDAGYFSDEVTYLGYSEDGYKGQQNRFIELLTSIIESSASYNDLMSPLDSDTIKDTIHKVDYLKSISKEEREAFKELKQDDKDSRVSKFAESQKETGLQQMFPVSLVKSRSDMTEAKTLVAIMANNMSDLGESQKAKFGLKYNLGIDMSGSLAKIYAIGKEDNTKEKLSKRVSYFMNSAVDAAKDNYIISGNVTSYSSNAVMMMARLGIPLEDLFTITMNKEILDMSRYKNYQKAKLSDYSFDYSQADLDTWSVNLLNKLSSNNFDIFEVVSREDFLANTANKKEDILGFWNLLQTMGKEFNNAIIAMKSDSNNASKSIPEFISHLNRIERVKYDGVVNSFEKWFEGGEDHPYVKGGFKFDPELSSKPGVKLLGSMANNTLFLTKELSSKLFIELSPNVLETTNDVLASLGNPLETSADTIALVQNYMFPYLLYKTGHRIYDIDKDREDYLLEVFPGILQQYKDRNPDILFLKHLEISTYKKKNLIKFPNFKNFSQADKVGFKSDINYMLNDIKKYGEDHDFFELVDDMIQYGFLTTGFKRTYYDFNDVMPATYFVKRQHGKAISEYLDSLNSIVNNVPFGEALTLMAKTHHTNYKIVRKLSGKYKAPDGDGIIEDKDTLDKLTLGPENSGNYVPFFKRKKTLYMMIGKTDEGYPIYDKTDKINNKEFNVYSFHSIDKRLEVDYMEYISGTKKIMDQQASVIDENMADNEESCNN